MKNSKNIKISIIIPCYNVANYLKTCLKSISIQPLGDVEYIFVDDGSTDESLIILKGFCKDKSNCHLISQQNAGVSAARNAALDIAKGEYIYLLDGDDILTNDAVSLMLESVQDTSVDVVLSEVTILKDETKRRERLSICAGEYTPEELYELFSIFPTKPQLLYKRDIINVNNIRFNCNLRLGEVYDFTIKVLSNSSKIKVVSDCFFYYVMRSSSATHKPNYKTDLTVIDTLEQYECYGKRLNSFISFQVTAFKMIMSFTYNKYAKLGLNDEVTINTINNLLSNSIVNKFIRNVAFGKNVSIKERMLALYINFTGVWGYKLIAKVL